RARARKGRPPAGGAARRAAPPPGRAEKEPPGPRPADRRPGRVGPCRSRDDVEGPQRGREMEAGIALERLAARRHRAGSLALVGLDRRRRCFRVRHRNDEPPSAARTPDPVLDPGGPEDEGDLAERAPPPPRTHPADPPHPL